MISLLNEGGIDSGRVNDREGYLFIHALLLKYVLNRYPITCWISLSLEVMDKLLQSRTTGEETQMFDLDIWKNLRLALQIN